MTRSAISRISGSVIRKAAVDFRFKAVRKLARLRAARGDAPMTAVEFARRNIDPHERPSFAELEALTRRKAA